MKPDLVIVGGGIAGGALATVAGEKGCARSCCSSAAPSIATRSGARSSGLWGVAVAQRLEIAGLLLDAGAKVVPALATYDEGMAGSLRDDLGAVVPGVAGSLNIAHPAACAALAEAAAAAGADVRRGVGDVRVRPGRVPSVVVGGR